MPAACAADRGPTEPTDARRRNTPGRSSSGDLKICPELDLHTRHLVPSRVCVEWGGMNAHATEVLAHAPLSPTARTLGGGAALEATRRHGVFALRCARRTALPAPLLQTAQTILAQQLPAHYPSACPRLTLCYLLCDVACTGCDHLRDGGVLLSDHLRDGVQP